mgnify:CR=1 FL=1|tara:strand:+ start:13790 stop:14860 length:1071 start_codon:yes stop_codon:yes gene_type:complete
MLHKLKASSANVWTKCAGSAKLALEHEIKTESDARKEGTAAHHVIELIASGETPIVGALTPNGWAIDDDMIEGAKIFLEAVGARATHETKVNCDQVIEGLVAIPDASRYERDDATVYLWDYKYGNGYVGAEANAQMLVEASAFLDHQPARFVMTVVQPRCFTAEPVRSWEVSIEDYTNIYLPMLQEAAKEAQVENPLVETGEHCNKCPARHACRVLQAVSAVAVDASMSASSLGLQSNHLGTELSILEAALDRIESRIKGLREQATSEIENGRPVLGYEIAQKYGRNTWCVPKENVIALGDIVGIDLRKPSEPITPAQAKKAGFDAKTLETMATKPFRGSALKKVDTQKMKGVFSK